MCHFVLVFFSPFSIAISSLGEARPNLSAFRTFVRFALVWICRFPLPLGVWEGLRFVFVALPGRFSYIFFTLLTVLRRCSRCWSPFVALLFILRGDLFYVLDGFVSCKMYDKCDDFDFEIVNFPFLDGDVPRPASYGVYISQLIRFARVSSHVTDFSTRNKLLTAKLCNQGYRYHKVRKAFSKFYRRHSDLVSKFNVGLKSLLQQGLSEPEFYGDLVYKFRKIYACNDFSTQFRKIILRYKKIGYNINVIRQTACMDVNPIMVNNFAFLFNCSPAG